VEIDAESGGAGKTEADVATEAVAEGIETGDFLPPPPGEPEAPSGEGQLS
jgi:hypothetical protein